MGSAPGPRKPFVKGLTENYLLRFIITRPSPKHFCPSHQVPSLTLSPEKKAPFAIFSKNSYISKIPLFFSAFSLAKWKGPC